MRKTLPWTSASSVNYYFLKVQAQINDYFFIDNKYLLAKLFASPELFPAKIVFEDTKIFGGTKTPDVCQHFSK